MCIRDRDHVKFNSELKILDADEAEVVFTAASDKGWHVYSTDLGDGGPISATFNVEKISGAEEMCIRDRVIGIWQEAIFRYIIMIVQVGMLKKGL